jgi:hypothetical protein
MYMYNIYIYIFICIGVHGAGLSNQIYMKPNSAIVELCPYGNDGRCLLGDNIYTYVYTYIYMRIFYMHMYLFIFMCIHLYVYTYIFVPVPSLVDIFIYTYLGGGPFSRAAVLMSHNYMIHHPPKSEFK